MRTTELETFYLKRWEMLPDFIKKEGVDPTVVYDRDYLAQPGASPVMLVGEAPGGEEVAQGRPFVGQAGKNLKRLLEKAGLDRSKILITNLFPFRTFAQGAKGVINRTPKTLELEAGAALLEVEIGIVRPSAIILLGLSAHRGVMRSSWRDKVQSLTLGSLVKEQGGCEPRFWGLSYHPSPLNFNQPSKRAALEDFFERLATMV
ncbi:MAG: uracil-DNA glycosylase [Campylobacterales bacterium]